MTQRDRRDIRSPEKRELAEKKNQKNDYGGLHQGLSKASRVTHKRIYESGVQTRNTKGGEKKANQVSPTGPKKMSRGP